MYENRGLMCDVARRAFPMYIGIAAKLGGVGLLALAGCSQHVVERGWSDSGKVQVQFYSPPGATVAVKNGGTRSHPVGHYGDDNHRLELAPEEFSVFNLPPGRHAFKYITAEGFPGVSIYGELDIFTPCDAESAKFVRNSFVPIRLPSRYYSDAAGYHPAEGPSGAGLSETEVEHLAQGDLIHKVYFVADLEAVAEDLDRIEQRLDKLRSAEIVLNSSTEYYNTRHEEYRRDSLYGDPTTDSDDAGKEFWGSDREFNRIEAKRQRLENQRDKIRAQTDKLTQERRIRRTLLDSITIINRAGAMVLATPENQWPYHDAFEQVNEDREYDGFTIGPGRNYHLDVFELEPIGHVVAIMRVGGRHKQWGDPGGEMAAAKPEAHE